MSFEIPVLLEDNHLLALAKPARLLVAPDETGDHSLLDQARDYLRVKYQKPGNVFVGLVHRIDRPVSGVVLFARTDKAASRLSGFELERWTNVTSLRSGGRSQTKGNSSTGSGKTSQRTLCAAWPQERPERKRVDSASVGSVKTAPTDYDCNHQPLRDPVFDSLPGLVRFLSWKYSRSPDAAIRFVCNSPRPVFRLKAM